MPDIGGGAANVLAAIAVHGVVSAVAAATVHVCQTGKRAISEQHAHRLSGWWWRIVDLGIADVATVARIIAASITKTGQMS